MDQHLSSLQVPEPKLWRYYIVLCLLWGPLFPLALLNRYFFVKSLRYKLDDKHISMSYGRLSHKEVSLAYERVQDIHLRRNLLERYMGLARLEIQTASGDAGAEVVVRGFSNYEEIRAFLFERVEASQKSSQVEPPAPNTSHEPELTAVLLEVAEEMKLIRQHLQATIREPGLSERTPVEHRLPENGENKLEPSELTPEDSVAKRVS